MRQHVNPLSRNFNEIERIPSLIEIFGDSKLNLHLDIGCAAGDFLFDLALVNTRWNYLGIEIRERLVKTAKLKVREREIKNLYFVFGNAIYLSFPILGATAVTGTTFKASRNERITATDGGLNTTFDVDTCSGTTTIGTHAGRFDVNLAWSNDGNILTNANLPSGLNLDDVIVYGYYADPQTIQGNGPSTTIISTAAGNSSTYTGTLSGIAAAALKSLTVTGNFLDLTLDSGESNLETLSIDASFDDLSINGLTDLTSLTVASTAKFSDLTLTGTTNLSVADFNNSFSGAAAGTTAGTFSNVSVTNNSGLTKLHWAADDVGSLTVTGNDALVELGFTGLADDGTAAADTQYAHIWNNNLTASILHLETR